jgi:hypothetical protein
MMKSRISEQEFINRSKNKYGNKFEYSFLIYKEYTENVILKCKIHGLITIRPNRHLKSKTGCYECGNDIRKNASGLTNKEFIDRAKIVHNNFYEYDKTNYLSMDKYVNIKCPTHGYFPQIAENHIKGFGCQNCALSKLHNKSRKTAKQFIQEAILIHKDKYDYSLVVYKSTHEPVIIICREHGQFLQAPSNHISKNNQNGCKHCAEGNSSKKEQLWLDTLNISHLLRNGNIRLNGKRVNYDGFDPINNTIYEFHGDYWHGNPKRFNPNKINKRVHKRFKTLYKNTLAKEQAIRDAGYNLVVMWELDWDLQQPNPIKRKLFTKKDTLSNANIRP